MIIKGYGKPTETTVGKIGWTYFDMMSGDSYKCTDIQYVAAHDYKRCEHNDFVNVQTFKPVSKYIWEKCNGRDDISTLEDIGREVLYSVYDKLIFAKSIYRDADETKEASAGDDVTICYPETQEDNQIVEKTLDVQMQQANALVTVGNLDTYSTDTIRKNIVEPASEALSEQINDSGLYLRMRVPATEYSIDEFLKYSLYDGCAVFKDVQTFDQAIIQCNGYNKFAKLGGIDIYQSDVIDLYKAGTLVTAGTSLTVGAVNNDGNRIVLHSSGSISLKSLKIGDAIVIDNQDYTVTASSLAGSTTIEVDIYPAYTGETDVTVTLPNYTGYNNVVFDKKAFALVSRPLAVSDDADSCVVTYNGISLRVTRGGDKTNKTLNFDILYGVKTVHPELARRLVVVDDPA